MPHWLTLIPYNLSISLHIRIIWIEVEFKIHVFWFYSDHHWRYQVPNWLSIGCLLQRETEWFYGQDMTWHNTVTVKPHADRLKAGRNRWILLLWETDQEENPINLNIRTTETSNMTNPKERGIMYHVSMYWLNTSHYILVTSVTEQKSPLATFFKYILQVK
jgi:hypothetical protein